MVVTVEVAFEGSDGPPAGAPVLVQALDTSYADAPADVLAEAQAVASGETGAVGTVELAVAPVRSRDVTVRAHVDVDGDGQVSEGDFVTTASYPVEEGSERLRVFVRRV